MIELLIVMMIIGVLAGLSLFSLQGARKQGRDGKRKADLETIRSALELYKADCNRYPAPGSIPSPGNALSATCGGVTNTYINKWPGDPSGSSYGKYGYTSAAPYATYTLCAPLEDPPSPANDTSGCPSCSPASCGYKTINP